MLRRGRKLPPGDQSLIDRDPQNLPVSLGGFRVVRGRRRTSAQVKWWRANSPNLVAAAGLAAAVAGAYMALSAPAVPAYTAAGSVFIGGHELRPVPGKPGVYSGDATFIWPYDASGKHIGIAAASTSVGHTDVAGRCVMSKALNGNPIESCSFWVGTPVSGTPSFTSQDTYDLGASSPMWQRRYSDGVSVDITIPASSGGVVPVPLPVGR